MSETFPFLFPCKCTPEQGSPVFFRGTDAKGQAGLKTYEICKYFHPHASCGGSMNIYRKEILFFYFEFKSPRAQPYCFANKEQEKVGS